MRNVKRVTPSIIKWFTENIYMEGYDEAVAVPDFHVELWKYTCSTEKYVAVAAPRGFAKSTAVTHAGTLTEILCRTANYALIISDTEAQAVNFLHDIKAELEENEVLHGLFGVPTFLKDNEADCIIEWPDGHKQRISARSSLQKLRGLKWYGKRPDYIVGDDMENDEIVLNEERRLKFKRWIYGALLPMGSRKMRVRFVGTILHMDSLLMSFMPDDSSPHTHNTPLKMRSDVLKSGWWSVLFRAHPGIGDYSQLLWEDRFTAADLAREYAGYKGQGLSSTYSQEYLNHPVDPSEAYFREADFKDIPANVKKNPPPQTFYMYADLAISESSQAAWTVLLVAGVDNVGMVRIWDVVRFRGDSKRILEELIDLYLKWRCDTTYIEKENIARSIGPFLEQEIDARNLNMNIDSTLIPTKDKLMRSRSIQGRVRQGTVEFDMESHWWPTLKQEMETFPRSQYVDQVDALSMVGLTLSHMIPGMQEVNERSPFYDDDADEFDRYEYHMFSSDAESITGY